jgi:hypothetical protein
LHDNGQRYNTCCRLKILKLTIWEARTRVHLLLRYFLWLFEIVLFVHLHFLLHLITFSVFVVQLIELLPLLVNLDLNLFLLSLHL